MVGTTARTLVALAAVLRLANPSVADAGSDESGLWRDVQRAITNYAFFTVFDDVRPEIDDEGIVILRGYVTSLAKRTALARRVRLVEGVVGVRNDLDVLPVSRRDTELRYRVARAIYGNQAFWHYAARPNPPIHILVKDGHVTLRGLVDTEIDRAMASVLASPDSMASFRNELRLVDEIRGGPPLD